MLKVYTLVIMVHLIKSHVVDQVLHNNYTEK